MNTRANAHPVPVSTPRVTVSPFWLCVGIPLLTWLGAYAQMALKYDTWWLFPVVVHENGELTLWQTILYFNHFMRELPIEVLYVLFGTGVFLAYGPPARVGLPANRRRNLLIGFTVGLILFTAWSVWGSIQTVGAHETLLDIGQARNRHELEWARGPHWRNHLLSFISGCGLFLLAVWIYRRVWDGGWIRRLPVGVKLTAAGIAGYILVTLAFGINADPFTNMQYLGHQMREIAGKRLTLSTFVLLGTLIFWERRLRRSASDDGALPGGTAGSERRRLGLAPAFIGGIVFLVPALYLAGRILLGGDIGAEIAESAEGREWGMVDVFAFHFFEHCLDLVFTILLASVVYLLAIGGAPHGAGKEA